MLAADERTAIMGDYSTLEMLDIAIGANTAAKWLTVLVNDVNKFAGSKNMDEKQAESLAYLLAQEYKDMKISMMMLFFYRFKCGYFGKFYGKVDPMVITCALKDFAEECEAKRQEYLDEEYMIKKREEDSYRELLHHVESQWWRCQEQLVRSCPDKEGKDVFARMEFSFYDNDTKTLLFTVTREEYEMIEGRLFSLFSSAVRAFFPYCRIQYQLHEKGHEPVNDLIGSKGKAGMRR